MKKIVDEVIRIIRQMYDNNAFAQLISFCQGEYRTLNLLKNSSKGQLIPSEISNALQISRARVTATLTALRKKGFVTMETSLTDRRKVKVCITQEGIDYWQHKSNQGEMMAKKVLGEIGQEESKQFLDTLRHILQITGNGVIYYDKEQN